MKYQFTKPKFPQVLKAKKLMKFWIKKFIQKAILACSLHCQFWLTIFNFFETDICLFIQFFVSEI